MLPRSQSGHLAKITVWQFYKHMFSAGLNYELHVYSICLLEVSTLYISKHTGFLAPFFPQVI